MTILVITFCQLLIKTDSKAAQTMKLIFVTAVQTHFSEFEQILLYSTSTLLLKLASPRELTN